MHPAENDFWSQQADRRPECEFPDLRVSLPVGSGEPTERSARRFWSRAGEFSTYRARRRDRIAAMPAPLPPDAGNRGYRIQ